MFSFETLCLPALKVQRTNFDDRRSLGVKSNQKRIISLAHRLVDRRPAEHFTHFFFSTVQSTSDKEEAKQTHATKRRNEIKNKKRLRLPAGRNVLPSRSTFLRFHIRRDDEKKKRKENDDDRFAECASLISFFVCVDVVVHVFLRSPFHRFSLSLSLSLSGPLAHCFIPPPKANETRQKQETNPRQKQENAPLPPPTSVACNVATEFNTISRRPFFFLLLLFVIVVSSRRAWRFP